MNKAQADKNGDKRNPDGTFAEGNAGGPGRPSFSLISILKAELQKCPEGEDKKTYADLLIKRMLKSAISDGNDQQIKNILQYVEGMPKQTIKNEYDDEVTEIEVKIVRNNNEISDNGNESI